MKTHIHTDTHRLIAHGRFVVIAGALATALAFSAAAEDEHSHASVSPAKLVQLVRSVTQQFADVNAVTRAGYIPLFGCVSGPERGAMGVHYINTTLVGDGEIDGRRPEAIIYEPAACGWSVSSTSWTPPRGWRVIRLLRCSKARHSTW